jgi:hypothetical protein
MCGKCKKVCKYLLRYVHVYTCKTVYGYLSFLLKFVVYSYVLKNVAIKLHSTIGRIVKVITIHYRIQNYLITFVHPSAIIFQ